jgi:hypothetical protein
MSPCNKCSHSYECLSCGVNFEDCPMVQEEKMRENYEYKTVGDGWVLQIDKISHKIKVVEPAPKLEVIDYKKRNINLRRD